jgi:hypothetical protein
MSHPISESGVLLKKLDIDFDSNTTVQWLLGILRERISPSISLSRDHISSRWRISLPGQVGSVWIGDSRTPLAAPHGDAPCGRWDAFSEGWTPALPGLMFAPGTNVQNQPYTVHSANGWWLRYDVLTLIYHLLSRSEEVGDKTTDSHHRFPASASNAYQQGYLHRPVVDEWIYLLRQIIIKQWPRINLVASSFSVQPSHDVDFPSRYALRSLASYVRTGIADILRRRQFYDVARSPLWRFRGETSLHPSDPANTFDWIMDESERYGLQSTFYFICGRTAPEFDGGYEIEQPAMRELMRKINLRKHRIGLHPSYNTYLSPVLLAKEAHRLRRMCNSLQITQPELGGRMHYLRWSNPETPRAWVEAGIDYDATLTYADRAGFRCGTCFEYPAFDPVARESMPLRVRPLIAMECSVIDSEYMGLGVGVEAFNEFIRLKRACQAVGGTFSLLWHNTELNSPAQRDLYSSILRV